MFNLPSLNEIVDHTHGDEEKSLDVLKNIKVKNWDRVVIGCLNINSIRNKFDRLRDIVKGNLDVIIIIETKIDDSFPSTQFEIPDYCGPYRCDRNQHGGGIMVFIKSSIPSTELKKFKPVKNLEGIFIEINLRKQKILLFSGYRSDHETYGLSKSEFFHEITLGLDQYTTYDKFLLAGDFNIEKNEDELIDFTYQFEAKCLVNVPTCFKSDNNPTTVDHFITNAPRLFQSTNVISTGLSDFHKMIITVLKTGVPKSHPREISYRNYNRFDQEVFAADLNRVMHSDCSDYDTFENAFIGTLDKYAPVKTKKVRANHKPFITKQLRKAMVKTSNLQKNFGKIGQMITKSCTKNSETILIDYAREKKEITYKK